MRAAARHRQHRENGLYRQTETGEPVPGFDAPARLLLLRELPAERQDVHTVFLLVDQQRAVRDRHEVCDLVRRRFPQCAHCPSC